MKKTLLFSLMAVLLAGFGFGGVSLADCVAGAELNENEHVASITVDSATMYYCSLADAIAAVGNEQTEIVLLENLAESPVISGKNIILNLGSKTLTVDGWGLDVYGSMLTVKNGIIEVTGNVGIYLNNANNFTLDSTAKIIGTGSAITSDLYPEGATETNTVTISGEIDIENAAVNLSNTSTLIVNEGAKIKGTDGIIISSKALSSNVTVNGYVEGSNVGVTINGNIISATECPTITIGSNAEIVTDGDETVGLYLAGYGKTTIADGAKMSGTASAIEIRAGELTVNGGTFTSTANNFSITPNGNGSTTVGAAIAVSQHTTDSPINVVINGGTFDGVKALHEEDIQNEVATGDISISVTNGIFNGEVSSENITGFIEGGLFSTEPNESYIAEGKKASLYGNKYKVATARTVTFDPNNKDATASVDVADGTTVTKPADPTNTGYIFQGWFDGDDKFDFESPVTSNLALTAKWEAMTSSGGAKIDDKTDEGIGMVVEADVPATETAASAVQSSNSTATVQGEVELNVYNDADGSGTPDDPSHPISSKVNFTKVVLVRIPVASGSSVKVKVKHNGDSTFGTVGLTTSSTATCDNGVSSVPYNGGDISVTSGYAVIYTCSASTFVAYTEVTNPTSPSSTSGGGGGGGSSSYSCKSLPANAVANNTSKPKKNTNYSYSTDTGAVCTFQCKSGYTWNEKDEKCEKSEETVADTNENTDNADTSDSIATEDLKKVLDDGYNVEFHNAYDFAFKNGITTMPNIQAADMNSPLTRIAMAKMLSQYAINVLGKKPANVVVPNFPDVSPELDAEYNNGVTLAYQLGIMGINIENFRPDDLVTRAEFATALSRLLYNTSDGEGAYYETHLEKLMEEKIITVADPNMHELRGYVMIMLMRSAKNN